MQPLKDFLKEQDIKTTELYVNCMEFESDKFGVRMKFKLDLHIENPLPCRCGGNTNIATDGCSVYCDECGITTRGTAKRKSIKAWNKVME